jgi:transposase
MSPRALKPKPAPLTAAEIDQIPAALDNRELARCFGRSVSTIYDWERDGRLRQFALRRPMTSKKWSGRLVADFLRGSGNALDLLRRRTA